MVTESNGHYKIEIELDELSALHEYQKALITIIQQACYNNQTMNHKSMPDVIHYTMSLLEQTLIGKQELQQLEKVKDTEQQLKKAI